MTLFAESGGILGIDCESCNHRVAGRYANYTELLQAAAGWTFTACPSCRPERRGNTGTPRAFLTGWPPAAVDRRRTA